MVVVGNAATLNEKEVKTRYPVEEGLTAGTTKQTGTKSLSAQGLNGKVSCVVSKNRAGL